MVQGAGGSDLGVLHYLEGQAAAFVGNWAGMAEANLLALPLLQLESPTWFACTSGMLLAGTFLGDMEIATRAVRAILNATLPAEVSGTAGMAIFSAGQGLCAVGETDAARVLVGKAESVIDGRADIDWLFVLWVRVARALINIHEANLGGALTCLNEACVLADGTGSAMGRDMAGFFRTFAYSQTGHAERTLLAQRFNHSSPQMVSDWSTYHVALLKNETGSVEDAIPLLEALVAPATERNDLKLLGEVHATLALAHLRAGDVGAARSQAALAAESATLRSSQATRHAVLALLELESDGAEAAIALAEQGLVIGACASLPTTLAILRLVRARALQVLGRVTDARAAIREARDRILQAARTLEEPELCEAYLTQIRTNEETLRLAREWEDVP
jgi:tetratricopeptide (TPR) repeat protein